MNTVISPVNVDARKNLDLRSGDTVRVYQKIQEKGKTRLQVFEGLVLARKHGKEAGATFTVRRNTGGYGVEKIFPLYSPMIDKIEVTKRSKTRRSKLYFIRDTALKQAKKRLKMMFVNFSDEVKEEDKPVETESIQDKANEANEANDDIAVDITSDKDVVVDENVEVVEDKKEE